MNINNSHLDLDSNWNTYDDSCFSLIDTYEEIEFMNAFTTDLNQIITLYLEHFRYKDKHWRVGFRQALFVCLDDISYERFIKEVSKYE